MKRNKETCVFCGATKNVKNTLTLDYATKENGGYVRHFWICLDCNELMDIDNIIKLLKGESNEHKR